MSTRSGPTALSGADDAVVITPHASNTFGRTAAITCGVEGTAVVRFAKATDDVTVYLLAGIVYPYQIIAVRATGTTADDLVALYN